MLLDRTLSNYQLFNCIKEHTYIRHHHFNLEMKRYQEGVTRIKRYKNQYAGIEMCLLIQFRNCICHHTRELTRCNRGYLNAPLHHNYTDFLYFRNFKTSIAKSNIDAPCFKVVSCALQHLHSICICVHYHRQMVCSAHRHDNNVFYIKVSILNYERKLEYSVSLYRHCILVTISVPFFVFPRVFLTKPCC